MLMVAPSAPGLPDCCVTVTPGASPCNKLLDVATCLLVKSSFFNVTTEPVKLTFSEYQNLPLPPHLTRQILNLILRLWNLPHPLL